MMMLCFVGTHALESLSEISSFREKKKSLSNFRWSNCSYLARAMRKSDEFTRCEYEGWQRVAEKYDAVWSSLTRQFIPYLIDAAQVSTGLSVLDVACGPGIRIGRRQESRSEPDGRRFLQENDRDRQRHVSRNRFSGRRCATV